jgi:hypothetical protein
VALYFKTGTPKTLLADFKKKIDDGDVVTWSYDGDGDFTHTPPQWKNQAWLRPSIEANQLALYIIKPSTKNITREVYGVYHGRFIESMLTHCDRLFTTGDTTALAVSGKDKTG